MYLFGEPVPVPPPPSIAPTTGLTPEEQDIYKKLQDKVNRSKEGEETEKKKETMEQKLTGWYKQNMEILRSYMG
jgi:hypothetical protein